MSRTNLDDRDERVERVALVQLELNYLEAKIMSEHELHGFSEALKSMFAKRGEYELEFQQLQQSLQNLIFGSDREAYVASQT